MEEIENLFVCDTLITSLFKLFELVVYIFYIIKQVVVNSNGIVYQDTEHKL